MAKKNDLDDLDLDSFDDWDDGLDITEPKDDRNPVTKVASSFAIGMKEELLNPNELKRRLLNVLPEGYTQASNLVDEVKSTGAELYNTAVRNLKPAERDFHRATRALMPKVEGKVPKAWTDRLKDLGKKFDEREKDEEDRARNGGTGGDFRQTEIDRNLAEIFDANIKASAEIQERATERQSVEGRLKERKEDRRSATILGQLDGIRQATNRQVSFQDQITARYQRKNLEIQYRQLFTLRDLVEQQGSTSKLQIENLASIVKNTALPEYQKIKLSEVGTARIRDRMLLATEQGVASWAGNFIGQTRKNITETLGRTVSGFTETLAGGLQQLGDANDMADMAGDMGGGGGGINAGEVAGHGIGATFANKLIEMVSPYIRDVVSGNDKINRGSNFLSYYANSLPQMINQWALSDQGEAGLAGGLVRFGKELLPKYYLDATAGEAPLLDADQPATFDSLTRRSITEIIPGYLSRIHHELAIMRTGDPGLDRITYNLDRGSFTSLGTARTDVKNRIFNPAALQAGSESLNEFITSIDRDGQLSDSARATLSRQLLRDVSAGLPFDVGRYSDSATYSGDDVREEDQYAIADLIRGRFDADEEGRGFDRSSSALVKARSHFNQLSTALPDPKQRIRGYRETGQRELLEDLGLVERQDLIDFINYDRVWDIYRRGDTSQNGSSTTSPSPGVLGVGGMGGLGNRGGGGGGNPPPPPTGDASTGAGGNPDAGGVNLRDILDTMKTGHQGIIRGLESLNANRDTSERNDYTDPLNKQVDLLTRIVGILEEGITVHGGEGPGFWGGKEWWKRSARRAGKGAGRLFDGATSLVGRSLEGIGSVVRGTGRMYGSVFSGAAGLLTRGLNRLRDIYVAGENSPRLTVFKLRMGEYKDQVSGKVIKTLKDLQDLKGPVIDRMGNVVLSMEDVARGLFDRDHKSILRNAGGLALKMGKGLAELAGKPYVMAFRGANWARNKIMEWSRRSPDIYVQGENTPRLLAMILRNGGYFNQGSGTPIHRIRDIADNVVDRAGNVVLSLDDMRKGLVDQFGKPIHRFGKLGQLAENAIKMPVRAGRWALQKGREAFDTVAGGVKDLWKKFTDPGMRGEGKLAKRQLGVLERIYELLDKRLPPAKGRFDLDGSGMRDGSWREILKRRREEQAEKKRQAEEANTPTKGLLGGLLGGLAGLFGKNKGGDEDEDDGDTTIIAGGLDTLKKGLAKVGGGIATAASWVGRKAIKPAARVGTQLAMRGLVWGATALAATLTAPVALGLGAVALAGGLGYMAYRKYKNSRPTPIRDYRMTQYGVVPDNQDDVSKMLYLEDYLQSSVRISGGKASLDGGSLDLQEMLEGFGLNMEDEDQLQSFSTWFQHRFLPVFMTHQTALGAIDDSVKLADVDEDLDAQKKTNYIAAVGFGDKDRSPYSVVSSPFAAGTTLKVSLDLIESYKNLAVTTAAEEQGNASGREVAEATRRAQANRDSQVNQAKEQERYSLKDTMAPVVSKVAVEGVNRRAREQQQAQRTTRSAPAGFIGSANAADFGASDSSATDLFLNGAVGATVHPGNGTGGNINDLPLPTGDGSWDNYRKLIVAAARMAGVDPGIMATMASIESGFRGQVRAGTSSATGLYQFIDETWKEMVEKYGSKYGIAPGTPPTDPRANALLGAEFLKENINALKRRSKRNVTDTDLYLAHFMGAGGANSMLSADPNAIAARLFSRQAAANRNIFYDGDRARTVAEVYRELDRRVVTHRKLYADKARQLAGQLGPVAANDEVVAPEPPTLDEGAIQAAIKTGTAPTPVETPSATTRSQEMIRSAAISRNTTPTFQPSGTQEPTRKQHDVSALLQDRDRRIQAVAEGRDRVQIETNRQHQETMSGVSEILTESLATQRESAQTLREIADYLKNRPGPSYQQPAEATPAAVQRGPRPSEGVSRSMPLDVGRNRRSVS